MIDQKDRQYTTTEVDSGKPWLTLVGLSEAGWAGLGGDARAAVRNAELLVGGKRHLAHVPRIEGQEQLVWPSPIEHGIEAILARQHRPVCVLASGDPFWFGIGATLARQVPPEAMRTYPGPSAFSLAAARLGWALQSIHCTSLVNSAPDNLRPMLLADRRLLVLSRDGTSPAKVAKVLCEQGFGASRVVVLEALGGPAESVHEALARDWRPDPVAALNTLAIECREDPERTSSTLVPGRTEADFHSDGQITKREPRALILALLAPRGGEHLWDVGAGSGAISIEWLLASEHNTASAVECRPERLAGLVNNARRHGVAYRRTLEGSAPSALAALPPPDAVFIGGGISQPGVVDTCWQALKPGGRCVASAVTVEGEATLLDARARFGGELTRLAVERCESLGRFRGWRPQRTVTLWSATRTDDKKEERS